MNCTVISKGLFLHVVATNLCHELDKILNSLQTEGVELMKRSFPFPLSEYWTISWILYFLNTLYCLFIHLLNLTSARSGKATGFLRMKMFTNEWNFYEVGVPILLYLGRVIHIHMFCDAGFLQHFSVFLSKLVSEYAWWSCIAKHVNYWPLARSQIKRYRVKRKHSGGNRGRNP